MTLSLLVFGAGGQIGTELRRLAGPALRVIALDREAADLRDPEACAAAIARTEAEAVVNAAAYTAVDRAETEEALAARVNAEAPGAMARAAAARGLPFVHFSTDYVFDGSGDRPWRETDRPAPLNAYGRTKLHGERRVAEAGGAHAVIRTSWVHAGHGANFVRAMMRLARERDRLSVVDDQRGGPTAAADAARAAATVARALVAGRGASGVLHYTGAPAASWREFAEAIFAQGVEIGALSRRPEVTPIPSSAWPTPAARPRNSVLDCGRIGAVFGVEPPDWRASLRGVLEEIAEADKATRRQDARAAAPSRLSSRSEG
jgi:dTDP-4-dehydrorhamnose reductase